jgi:UDP-N-acetyl-D-galactosamine dehydrogenase
VAKERILIMYDFKNGICIVGMGYVGLQLATEFAKHIYNVYGVDINEDKINKYKNGIDETETLKDDELSLLRQITFCTDINQVPEVDAYIVCVPTPVDENRKPNIKGLKIATESVGRKIQKGNLIVFESTVAPKTTEEICVPILESASGMKCNKDFYVGFSPERLAPGTDGTKLKDLVKIISGSNDQAYEMVRDLYGIILPPKKLCDAPDMNVAEMAKIMENVKRDVNIALMNEFQMICHETGIDFDEVLRCARTKWCFDSASYNAGMVGGHCIGVDPYYLIDFVAQNTPNLSKYSIIAETRKVNESVPVYLANIIKKTLDSGKITICGFSFKENCADVRNTKVYDLYKCLKNNFEVFVYDPKCDKDLVKREYGIELVDNIPTDNDCIFIALKENKFDLPYAQYLKENGFVFDYKKLLSGEHDYKIYTM